MEKYPLFQAVLRKGTVLVLSGEKGYTCHRGKEKKTAMQPSYIFQIKDVAFSGELL